jgi:hypothetical protein
MPTGIYKRIKKVGGWKLSQENCVNIGNGHRKVTALEREDPIVLERLHRTTGYGTVKLSEMYGCSPSRVWNYLHKLGICRNHSEAQLVAIERTGISDKLRECARKKAINFHKSDKGRAYFSSDSHKEVARKVGKKYGSSNGRKYGIKNLMAYMNYPRFSNTKPEIDMKRCLTENGVEFIHQYPVENM